jgi:uncharacterized protein (DUF433 family)
MRSICELASAGERKLSFARSALSFLARNMTDWRELITADPEVMVGKPVIAGTRLTVEFIVERLADGWTEDELLQNYPSLTREQIHACLAYDLKDHESIAKSRPIETTRRKSKRGNLIRTRDSETGRVVDGQRPKRTRREILFPTEPTSIPHEQIDRAIDAVMSRKK